MAVVALGNYMTRVYRQSPTYNKTKYKTVIMIKQKLMFNNKN